MKFIVQICFYTKIWCKPFEYKIKFVSIQLMIKYLGRNHFEHFLEMWHWKLKYTFLLKFQVVDIFDFEDLFSKIEILTGEHSLPGHILALVLLFITKKDYKLLKASLNWFHRIIGTSILLVVSCLSSWNLGCRLAYLHSIRTKN